MDMSTMKDYVDDLILQVNTLEGQFRTLEAIIEQLQEQRDIYKTMYEHIFNDWKKLIEERAK